MNWTQREKFKVQTKAKKTPHKLRIQQKQKRNQRIRRCSTRPRLPLNFIDPVTNGKQNEELPLQNQKSQSLEIQVNLDENSKLNVEHDEKTQVLCLIQTQTKDSDDDNEGDPDQENQRRNSRSLNKLKESIQSVKIEVKNEKDSTWSEQIDPPLTTLVHDKKSKRSLKELEQLEDLPEKLLDYVFQKTQKQAQQEPLAISFFLPQLSTQKCDLLTIQKHNTLRILGCPLNSLQFHEETIKLKEKISERSISGRNGNVDQESRFLRYSIKVTLDHLMSFFNLLPTLEESKNNFFPLQGENSNRRIFINQFVRKPSRTSQKNLFFINCTFEDKIATTQNIFIFSRLPRIHQLSASTVYVLSFGPVSAMNGGCRLMANRVVHIRLWSSPCTTVISANTNRLVTDTAITIIKDSSIKEITLEQPKHEWNPPIRRRYMILYGAENKIQKIPKEVLLFYWNPQTPPSPSESFCLSCFKKEGKIKLYPCGHWFCFTCMNEIISSKNPNLSNDLVPKQKIETLTRESEFQFQNHETKEKLCLMCWQVCLSMTFLP